MPLGMEVELGTGHIVLDGDPALPPPSERVSIVAMVAHLSHC